MSYNVTTENLIEYNDKLINEVIEKIEPSDFKNSLRIKEIALQILDNYIEMRKMGIWNYPETMIIPTIIDSFKRKSAKDSTITKIYNVFAFAEYDQFKTNPFRPRKKEGVSVDNNNNNTQLIQSEKHVIDSQIPTVLNFINSNMDHPLIKAAIERHAEMLLQKKIKERKEKEQEEKIRMPLPENTGKESLTSQATKEHIQAWENIHARMLKYPPADPELDAWIAERINLGTAMIIPGTDLKYSRDLYSYFDMSYEKETQSVHSSQSKSKIKTATNRYRKVTREHIGDISPTFLVLAYDIVQKIPEIDALQHYLRECQKPYNGDWHLNRHDKLSESAFGKSSYMD